MSSFIKDMAFTFLEKIKLALFINVEKEKGL